jgi:hypothetical protein
MDIMLGEPWPDRASGLLAFYYFFPGPFGFGGWTVWIWPSSILLMATDGNEKSSGALLICIVSVALNILLYAFVGIVIRQFLKTIRRNS